MSISPIHDFNEKKLYLNKIALFCLNSIKLRSLVSVIAIFHSRFASNHEIFHDSSSHLRVETLFWLIYSAKFFFFFLLPHSLCFYCTKQEKKTESKRRAKYLSLSLRKNISLLLHSVVRLLYSSLRINSNFVCFFIVQLGTSNISVFVTAFIIFVSKVESAI